MAKREEKIKIDVVQPKVQKKNEVKEVVKLTTPAKRTEKIENLYQALGEVERTIQELTRLYAETPDSGHMGVGGILKPTDKQLMVKEQLDKAEERAEKLIALIDQQEII